MRRILPFLILVAASFSFSSGQQEKAAPLVVFCYGDSLTSGYGLDSEEAAYPSLLEKRLTSLGILARVINAGLSGETSAGGVSRLNWVLRHPPDWPRDLPFALDVFLLALGSNDGLRDIPLETTRSNLQKILDQVRERYPGVQLIVAGLEMPVNWGEPYRSEFRQLFRDLAKENDAAFIPFLLEGVGGAPELMQRDQMHPNARGQKRVEENVWSVLKKVLDDRNAG